MDRQHVLSLHESPRECAHVDVFEHQCLCIRVARCLVVETNQSPRRPSGIAPRDLGAIEIGDESVVILHPQLQCIDGGKVNNVEGNAQKDRGR